MQATARVKQRLVCLLDVRAVLAQIGLARAEHMVLFLELRDAHHKTSLKCGICLAFVQAYGTADTKRHARLCVDSKQASLPLPAQCVNLAPQLRQPGADAVDARGVLGHEHSGEGALHKIVAPRQLGTQRREVFRVDS